MWQPIDTAPKDGTRILVWDGRHMSVAEFMDDYGWGGMAGEYQGGRMVEYQEHGIRLNPTHWMPLPDIPCVT